MKLIIIFSMIFTGIFLVTTIANTLVTDKYIGDEVERALMSNVNNNALLIEEMMGDHFDYMATLSEHPEIYQNGNNPLEYTDAEWSQFASQFHPQMERKGYVRMFLSDDQANSYRLDDERVHVNITTREYYQTAMAGQPNISDVLIGAESGEPILIIAEPIDRNGSIQGILYAVMNHSEIDRISSQLTYGETGFSYIVNGQGDLITSPVFGHIENQANLIELANEDSSSVGLAELLQNKVLQGETGYGQYRIDGNDLVAAYTPINHPYLNWYMVTVVHEDEVFLGVKSASRIGVLVSVISLLIVITVVYFASDKIAKPIVAVTQRLNKLAVLDFSEDQNVEESKEVERKDEIGEMTKALISMRDNIVKFIKSTADSADQVASSSEELTVGAHETSNASMEVAKTINEIAKGATDQANDTENTANNIEELSRLLDNNAKFILKLNEAAGKIDSEKEGGFKILSELVGKTKASTIASEKVYETILSNNKSAKKIETASSMIQSIADQTNLLALNAAIEAARAGEAGRGFAVVAGEIRKLAEDSNRFTSDIKEVIEELKSKSENAVDTMNEVKEVVEEQRKSVKETEEKFDGIAEATDLVREVVDKLNESSELMAKNKDNIIELVQNLSAIAEENAAGTEEASAATEQQAANIKEVANAGENLATIAEDLQTLIDRFKV
ncbi:methyl-accepting chemotaxis protein [Desulfitispora alkaliphila]|uniref:methyl-accepting chemotaxis protein n=1 Tax=Desulfitispora alkaliphila TaxID=622674 RepID=UPI003D2436C2